MPPIHVVAVGQDLDRGEGKRAVGGLHVSPHGMMQDYLNRTPYLWGIVTNPAGDRSRPCQVRGRSRRAFPIGLVLENPVFTDYLARLGSSAVATAAIVSAEAREQEAAPVLSVVPPPEASTEEALGALLAKVERYGFTRENLVTVALRDYGKPLLTDLTAPEIAALDGRIEAAAQKLRRRGRRRPHRRHRGPGRASSCGDDRWQRPVAYTRA